jgi:hypothetical protein
VTTLSDGPANQWITAVNAASAPDVRGPLELSASGLYMKTSSHVDVPALKSRIFLVGYDGMWITPGRNELAPVLGKADAVLMLGDDGAQYDGRLEYLLDGRNAIRAVAHRKEAKPKGTHELAIHGDWTTRAGALAILKPLVMHVLKHAAGRK